MSSFLDYKFDTISLDDENKGMADTIGIPWQEVSKSENKPISEQSLRTLQKYDAFMGLIKLIFDTDHDTGEVIGFSKVLEKREREKERERSVESVFTVKGSILFFGFLGLIGLFLI